MRIRPADVKDSDELAQLAWLAKASWGYSHAQLEAWREGLTPSPKSIAEQPTFVEEVD